MNTIADRVGQPAPNLSHALKNLIGTGIVEKRYAMTEADNKKKVQYCLSDEMLRFWYRFVPDVAGAVEIGEGRAYFYQNVAPYLSEYMGPVFEKMCRAYTLRAGISGALKCNVTQTGSWWGANPKTREQTDIDVVGLDKRRKQAVIGECKFRTQATDRKVYEALEARTDLLHDGYQVIQLLIFSLSEFSDWLLQHEREDSRLRLITLDELYGD